MKVGVWMASSMSLLVMRKAMFDADAQLRYELFGDVDSREA